MLPLKLELIYEELMMALSLVTIRCQSFRLFEYSFLHD